MSYAWSVVGRALVGLLLMCVGAVLIAPLFSEVSLSAYTDREAEAGERIEEALQQKVSFQFVDVPLKDAIRHFADKTNITVVLTKKIEDAGVQPDQPVNFEVKDVSANACLKLMLGNLNLTTMTKNEVLKITTIEDAQSPENMTTRIYPIADLADVCRAPAAEGGGVYYNFGPIIEVITSTVEPDSWQDVGGPGAINGHENSRTLVVSQRRDIHQRVAATLTTLRRAKQLQAMTLQSLPISNSALPTGGSSASLPIRSKKVATNGSAMGGSFGPVGGCF
ncbi:hypothetical protein [Anatilimnocola floriformis]|uniref:hypothetical protein n=1 Tax=Anatilimnocola floriformis TaxID=2948575 RepID=UPI0020C41AAC|nr:hypothetical protein [Anatilimnocola floriformis]